MRAWEPAPVRELHHSVALRKLTLKALDIDGPFLRQIRSPQALPFIICLGKSNLPRRGIPAQSPLSPGFPVISVWPPLVTYTPERRPANDCPVTGGG